MEVMKEIGMFSGIFVVVYLLSCFEVLSSLFVFIGAVVISFPIAIIVKKIVERYSRGNSSGKVKSAGRAVFITGCDTGFGHDLAKKLASDGFHVFAGCLFPEAEGATSLKSDRQNGGTIEVLQCDVTKNDQVLQCAATVTSGLKKHKLELWAVVNNAGIATFCEFEWIPVEVYEKILDVNALGSVRVVKAFLPLLRRSKGRIVILASLAGRYAIPYFTGYSMSKHAQVALADGLRRELKKFGIKVSLVEPGMYKTNMANSEIGLREAARHWEQGSDESKSHYGSEYYTRFRTHLSAFADKCSPDIHEVVDVMEEAVTSLHPKKRYVPGLNSSFVRGQLLPCLPYAVQDFVLAKLCLQHGHDSAETH